MTNAEEKPTSFNPDDPIFDAFKLENKSDDLITRYDQIGSMITAIATDALKHPLSEKDKAKMNEIMAYYLITGPTGTDGLGRIRLLEMALNIRNTKQTLRTEMASSQLKTGEARSAVPSSSSSNRSHYDDILTQLEYGVDPRDALLSRVRAIKTNIEQRAKMQRFITPEDRDALIEAIKYLKSFAIEDQDGEHGYSFLPDPRVNETFALRLSGKLAFLEDALDIHQDTLRFEPFRAGDRTAKPSSI